MKAHWSLPDRTMIKWTGTEWLFQLLEEAPASIRSRILMILWRSWFVRNELLHGNVPPPLDVSCSFLQSYHNTFTQISRSVDEIIKGKSPVAMDPICGTVKSVSREPWPPPLAGMVALSIDGSYRASDGSACSGMIPRTRTGEVVFAAYRKLFHCNDALEAELQALLEGIKLTTEHSEAPIMIQSDCVAAINAIKDTSLDNSAYGHMIQEIKFLLSDRIFIPVKVSRAQNRVADCLANFGRSGDSTACWLGRSPPIASDLVDEDCNSIMLE
ncbi:protein transport protein sec24 [Hordeum vulgare]|nr:protein transport protein sec24 [Hordeum vulgare]